MLNIISFPKLGLYFEINRTAISIGTFSIYWYGLIIGLGFAIALVYAIRESKRVGLSFDDLYNMLIIALPVSIICARLYYVIFNFDLYRDNLLSILNIRNGGIAIYGAVIGAFTVVFIYCKIKKLDLGLVLDILAIGLLIGQIIGRWGNFVNGEAFGGPTTLPWGMTIKSYGKVVAELVHPTFFYESLWNLAGLIILLIYKRFKKFNGELFCGYLIWYGIGRAMIEGLRTDALYIGALRVSQLLAIACVIAGTIIILNNRNSKNKKNLN